MDKDFKKSLSSYINKIRVFFEKNHVEIDKFTIDHICYKCSSAVEYENFREAFETRSKFIYQSIISERRIAYIKFYPPIETFIGELHYLELSDQKPNGSQNSGFDHIEIIPKKTNYLDMIELFKNQNFELKENVKPHHTTYDCGAEGFKIKLSKEKLVQKICREEMHVTLVATHSHYS